MAKLTARQVIEQIVGCGREAAAWPEHAYDRTHVRWSGCARKQRTGNRQLVTYQSGKAVHVSVIIKAHSHVDRDEGRRSYLRGVADDANDELRGLTDGE